MSKDNYLSYLNNKNSKSWILLAIFSLAFAGCYAIILIFVRTPFLAKFINKDFFKTALILHVNFSVLIWLLSVFISIGVKNVKKLNFLLPPFNYISWISLVLIIISPFTGPAQPSLNNYIPILHNSAFITGIGLFGTSVLIISLIIIIDYLITYDQEFERFVSFSCSLIILTSFLCFKLSHSSLQRIIENYPMDLAHFYELLFWGGGHVLQFCYTQNLMLVWVILSSIKVDRAVKFAFWLNLIIALTSPFIYIFTEADENLYFQFFTDQMRHLAGIAPMIIIFCLFKNGFKNNRSILLGSIILFLVGGSIGHMIRGSNTIIPSHYHGMIVGISLAYMGFIYKVIDEEDNKLAKYQPLLYITGQLLYIIGLVIAGGHGAMRKNALGEITLNAKLGMSLAGLGGIMAIIAGLLFVTVGLKSFLNKTLNTNRV